MSTVLIVDDEMKVRQLYGKLLRDEGFKVLEASNARDAKRISDDNHVDVMLLDINMPEIDGSVLYEIINLFKREVKVIVSSVYPVDYQKEKISGAVDYFDKSHGLDELVDKVVRASRRDSFNECIN